MGSLIVIVLLAVLLWVFVVLPSRRRQREHRAMQDSIEVGDDIITAGGVHGTIRELGEEELRLEIAAGVVVTLDRRAVAAVARDVEVEVEPEDELEDGEPAELELPDAKSGSGERPQAS